VAYAWIERTTSQGSERRELERGLTRLGGARAHVAIEGVSDDELQLWDDPPKLVHLGAEPHPTVNGRACTETALEPGDVIEWRGARFVFRTVARRAQLALEEETAAVRARGATAGGATAARRARRRARTGRHRGGASLARERRRARRRSLRGRTAPHASQGRGTEAARSLGARARRPARAAVSPCRRSST
jgi:hypothetical protein